MIDELLTCVRVRQTCRKLSTTSARHADCGLLYKRSFYQVVSSD